MLERFLIEQLVLFYTGAPLLVFFLFLVCIYCFCRTVLKELPRVLALYDIDMPLKDAKKAMTYHFRKYSKVEDERYIDVFLTFELRILM